LSHLSLRWSLNRALRTYFFGVYLFEIPDSPHSSENIIIASSHSSWWDVPLTYFLNQRVFSRKLRPLLLEPDIKRHPNMLKVGAIPVDSLDSTALTQTLHFLTETLNKEELLCLSFFPQGNIFPDIDESYNFKQSLAMLRPRRRTWIYPLYIKYEAGPLKLPLIYAAFGHKIFFDDYRSDPQLLQKGMMELRKSTGKYILKRDTQWNTLSGFKHKLIIDALHLTQSAN
jgi:1-acyl-sn-glycerol-3-phosphate acyltransferase